ncbi:dephospho-CoA kinase [Desulfotruncus alcoholivorax]|uniref:dephospho-CoA kinase n=1 Tax=Desulfotruncus alcoholivorax TaxID=265477 RepID=UPI0004030A2B|nr:dephospho-CoA kinase [Desulfotruncus alcoholivorax]
MLVVGLTGNIGSGKSTVARILKDLGARVVDTDQIARDVVAPGTSGLNQIINQFGTEVLNPDGTLNRRKMAQIVFGNPEALARLNGIIHPEIRSVLLDIISAYKEKADAPLLVIEVPLLFETGMNRLVDEAWLVTVEPEVQINRIISRDHASVEEAKNRIAAQMPQEAKIKLADRVIDNSNGMEETLIQVKKIWDRAVNP